MNKRFYLQLVLVVLLAFALKLHYSLASPDQLRWILAPTTLLVELVTGLRFHFESFAGYMSSDRRFLIAGSCAGINFLIASFLMLALRRLWIDRNSKRRWGFIPFAAVSAFCATLVANTVRISIALWMQHASADFGSLSRDQVHRLEGIVVYFAFLLALFWVSELVAKTPQRSPKTMFRLFAFPLAIYYVLTLVVPLVKAILGRGTAPGMEHSAMVLLVPLPLIGLFTLVVLLQHLGNPLVKPQPVCARSARARFPFINTSH